MKLIDFDKGVSAWYTSDSDAYEGMRVYFTGLSHPFYFQFDEYLLYDPEAEIYDPVELMISQCSYHLNEYINACKLIGIDYLADPDKQEDSSDDDGK
ncbi:hypothetical protein [Methylophaga sp.]|uniref:hypothetical protein n=1 Tax=Methylophaga sp. TaxID=2024840 RepID=UPI0027270F1C|nr:hypothetical protein [Methylophaga sp.]MDO8828465.1 hypothetical protein [Methylophaga sp.]